MVLFSIASIPSGYGQSDTGDMEIGYNNSHSAKKIANTGATAIAEQTEDDKGAWMAVPIPFANPTLGAGLQAAILYLHPNSISFHR